MSTKSDLILLALQNVDCGQDVYDALTSVPQENLKDMQAMIHHILENDLHKKKRQKTRKLEVVK